MMDTPHTGAWELIEAIERRQDEAYRSRIRSEANTQLQKLQAVAEAARAYFGYLYYHNPPEAKKALTRLENALNEAGYSTSF
jgi:hypothetical protein